MVQTKNQIRKKLERDLRLQEFSSPEIWILL